MLPLRRAQPARFALTPALLGLALLAAAPAEGRAATTVGTDLLAPISAKDTCPTGKTCTRMLLAVSGTEVASPVDGVIVRWRVVGTGPLRLRVLGRDGTNWTAGAVSEPATGLTPMQPRGTFDTRLPIAKGAFVAVEGDATTHVAMSSSDDKGGSSGSSGSSGSRGSKSSDG